MSLKLKCVFQCAADTFGKVIKFNDETLENCRYILKVRMASKLKYSDVVLPEQLDDESGYHAACRKIFAAVHKKHIQFYEESQQTLLQNIDPGTVASTSSVTGELNYQ